MQAQGKILQGHVVRLTILPHVEDTDHVGMGDGGGQASLPVKTFQIAGVLRQMGVHHFESDYLSCAGVPGLMHRGLPPGSDLLQNVVAVYLLLRHDL